MLDLGRDNVSMFCKSSFAPPSFLRTDQPNRAQPSSLLWSEDRVCSCCVCFVCTKHPHTQWRVNLCWYERQPGVYGFRRCKVRHEPTHSPPPALCYISLSAPCLYMFLGSFWGVSGSPPQRASYWLTRGLLVATIEHHAAASVKGYLLLVWLAVELRSSPIQKIYLSIQYFRFQRSISFVWHPSTLLYHLKLERYTCERKFGDSWFIFISIDLQ